MEISDLAVLATLLLVIVVLYRRFRRVPFKLLSWVAVAAGGSMVLGGVGHLVFIIAVMVDRQLPLDYRQISLIATGGILLFPGFLNIGLSKWIRQGMGWAMAMSAYATIALCIYAVLLLNMYLEDPTAPFAGADSVSSAVLIFNMPYLCLLLIVWLRRKREHLPLKSS